MRVCTQCIRSGAVAKTMEILDPDKPGVRLLIAVILAALCAALVTPGLFTRSLPVSDYYLDKPAEGDIKAYRDFKIPDYESTERKRKEAADKVPAVYDLDVGASKEAAARIRKAFSVCRTALEKIALKLQGGPAEKSEGAVREQGATAGGQAKTETGQARKSAANAARKERVISAEAVEAFMESHPDVLSVLGVNVAEADLRILARDGFSKETEAALVGIVGRVMSMPRGLVTTEGGASTAQ